MPEVKPNIQSSDKEEAKTENKKSEVKPNSQAIRDAHYYENGVKANGTGGKAPEKSK